MHYALALLVIGMSSVAHAEPSATRPELDLHVGVGFPAGGPGLSMRMGRIEVMAQGEILALGMAMAMSGSAQVNVDVLRRPRYGLYAGGFGARILAIAGVEEVVEDTYQGAGVATGLRLHHRSGSMSHAIEAGAFYGRCAHEMCDSGRAFISLQLAYRLHFHVF